MPGPLLVVDAPSLLYRAFYALPKSITDDDGRPVNALLGSTNIVLREIEEHGPRAVVMCFGIDAAKYRVALYDGYHADRPEVPDELAPQFAAAPGLYEALGWYTAGSDEFEADDLLGSYATVETEAGGETLILTGDRDMFQCVDDHVKVLYVRTGSRGAQVVDAAEVEARYGIPPKLVPDFIALRGDPSDGIPGAKGVGEKTAASLLRRYGSLEDALTGKLAAAADQLRAFKEMASLRRLEVERPADRATDGAGGAEAARAHGMNRLAERLASSAG
ncbi:MAG TPA: 5'-3' exonuclease H3TH domain-containing protein [Thermoleophilaceae bacterium]|nr:5'-3' exonuclease H3TH domain-containing protein [Thermoleophilaceae bacterium]